METATTTVAFNSFPGPAGAPDVIFKEMYAGTEHKQLTLLSLVRSFPWSPYTDVNQKAELRLNCNSSCAQGAISGINP